MPQDSPRRNKRSLHPDLFPASRRRIRRSESEGAGAQARIEPHLRHPHVRLVNGRPIEVASTVVNLEGARRRGEASKLLLAREYARLREPVESGPDQVQPGLFDVQEAEEQLREDALAERGRWLLRAGISGYARLTLDEACELALVRVRHAVARRFELPELEAIARELGVLEQELLRRSLSRLDAEDTGAVALAVDNDGA